MQRGGFPGFERVRGGCPFFCCAESRDMSREEYPFYKGRQWRRWQERLRKREVLDCDLENQCVEDWPVDEDDLASDIMLLGIQDRLSYGLKADLTDKQRSAYEEAVMGRPLTEIAKARGISYSSAWELLYKAARKVQRMIAGDRYAGWHLVYLEDVTRRKLF